MLPVISLINEAVLIAEFEQGVLINGRRLPCANLELNFAECLEAHGISKGMTICEKFMEDLHECKYQRISEFRQRIMREERLKKVIKGEIPFQNRWGPKPKDTAYLKGTFFP